MEEVRRVCEGKTVGPLTHIFRFDTPVEGYDSEIGFPVSTEVTAGDVKTHTLRRLHFFSLLNTGPVERLRETTGKISAHMNRVGLSSELELVEIYHQFNPTDESANRIEVQVAFLAWPEVYWKQLVRVLGTDLATEIWAGGEGITPFTLIDDRARWVGESLERLKRHSNQDQQFDILSRVALVRPCEDTAKYKALYEKSGRSGDVKGGEQQNAGRQNHHQSSHSLRIRLLRFAPAVASQAPPLSRSRVLLPKREEVLVSVLTLPFVEASEQAAGLVKAQC